MPSLSQLAEARPDWCPRCGGAKASALWYLCVGCFIAARQAAREQGQSDA